MKAIYFDEARQIDTRSREIIVRARKQFYSGEVWLTLPLALESSSDLPKYVAYTAGIYLYHLLSRVLHSS